MIQLVVSIILVSATADTTVTGDEVAHDHSRKVLVSTLIGSACIGAMGICHLKANDAYDAYLGSETMSSALEEWDRVRHYDNMRNILAIGAVVFIARAVYYQFRQNSVERSTNFRPRVDLQYACNSRVIVGFEKGF
ncbi:MAG: hypothetical protein JSU64_03330 [candidate division WOR-3 bacterium]|nr:MAG: hypothetical protein JSU64_03330 [candidate division WOR-3 bacterium]